MVLKGGETRFGVVTCWKLAKVMERILASNKRNWGRAGDESRERGELGGSVDDTACRRAGAGCEGRLRVRWVTRVLGVNDDDDDEVEDEDEAEDADEEGSGGGERGHTTWTERRSE